LAIFAFLLSVVLAFSAARALPVLPFCSLSSLRFWRRALCQFCLSALLSSLRLNSSVSTDIPWIELCSLHRSWSNREVSVCGKPVVKPRRGPECCVKVLISLVVASGSRDEYLGGVVLTLCWRSSRSVFCSNMYKL